ncbi:MAG: PEGA domain-containing protein [Polyangia bacterium]
MKKRTLIILIPSLAVLVNGTAYFIVRSARTPAASGRTSTVVAEPAAAPSAASRPAESSELVHRRRAVALAALEGGEYDKALANFEAVKAMGGADAHLDELIRVTEELLHNSTAKEHPRPQVARVEAPRLKPTRRSAAREPSPAAEVSPQPAPTPATGTLIVTTTPRGLLVRLDDSPLDLTPMRAAVKSGSHQIALLDGDHKVYETTLVVREAEVSTLSKDLSAELESDTHPGAAAPPSVAKVAVQPASPGNEAEKPPAPVPSPPPVSAVARPREASFVRDSTGTSTGTLAITSPGLYGVVWINGRPRGYPPLEVTDLPAGPAKVEVRVNGIEKRSSTVVVERERKISVTLRPDNKVR